MISVIVSIFESDNNLEECISSILIQTFQDIEILCVVNNSDSFSLSKLKFFEGDNRVKIIINDVSDDLYISRNIGLNFAIGDYVLFLESNQCLEKNALKNLYEFYKFYKQDIIVSFLENDNLKSLGYEKILNKVLNFADIDVKLIEEMLNTKYFALYKKEFLIKNNIEFLNENIFLSEQLFFLNNIFSSNKLSFIKWSLIEEIYSFELEKSDEFILDPFYKFADSFLKNEGVYYKCKNFLWRYIFGNIFDLIYNLRDEGTKRNYFKDSKLFFDDCCFNRGFYKDIHNCLDILVLEFFNQSLDEVYYSPKKRQVSRRLVNENFGPITIAIKTPNPIDDHTWGDYFFALSLKKSFEKRGFKVVIHDLEEWYSNDDNEDIVIVLRGLTKYIPNEEHINVMWNISHPEAVSVEEYDSYDVVFISSNKYAEKMKNKLDTVVKPLLQCTDPNVFHTKFNKKYEEDILFVGRTRNIFREIIKDMVNTSYDFSVYGEGWEKYIDKKFIKGEFIPNNLLNQYYSSCKILLNDHWKQMRDLDFPSNRLFDALACGAFIISDNISSAQELFENNVVTYKNSEDLEKKINFYLNNDFERDKKRKAGQAIVLSKHTFDNRANEIIETLKNITF